MADPRELTESIVHRFLSLLRYQRTRNGQIKQETGQSGRRLAILRCLAQQSPRTVGEIGRFLYVSDATVSRILDDMEGQGLVVRQRCHVDNRRVLVVPTEKGRALIVDSPKGVISRMRERLPALTEEELETIDWALARLSEVVQIDESVLEG
jgi:DNA-binding MarR family transcriptional regulator